MKNRENLLENDSEKKCLKIFPFLPEKYFDFSEKVLSLKKLLMEFPENYPDFKKSFHYLKKCVI